MDGAAASTETVDGVPTDRARLNAEARRIFGTSAWVGPFGTAVLTAIAAVVLRHDLHGGRLTAWVALIAVGVVGQAASVVVPSLRRWEARSGLPRLTYLAHGVVGLGYGLLPWLDSEMVDRTDLRWLVLTMLFAMSAGVASGLNGLNVLGLCVLAPMWTLASVALLAGGQWLVGAGGLLFLAIQIVDQRRSGGLWRELIALRIEQERRTEQQRWIAQHDDLTGLLNRAGVMTVLDLVAERAASAMYVDLDHFKEVNDQLGHAAGDDVLIEVGRRLCAAVRDDDVVGRLGGDEFFIVFPQALSADRIRELAGEVIASIELPIDTEAGRAAVSVSVGAATVDGRIIGGEELMAQADHALLRAKRRGRNRVEVFGT